MICRNFLSLALILSWNLYAINDLLGILTCILKWSLDSSICTPILLLPSYSHLSKWYSTAGVRILEVILSLSVHIQRHQEVLLAVPLKDFPMILPCSDYVLFPTPSFVRLRGNWNSSSCKSQLWILRHLTTAHIVLPCYCGLPKPGKSSLL